MFAKGTRFKIPGVKREVLVEDLRVGDDICGVDGVVKVTRVENVGVREAVEIRDSFRNVVAVSPDTRVCVWHGGVTRVAYVKELQNLEGDRMPARMPTRMTTGMPTRMTTYRPDFGWATFDAIVIPHEPVEMYSVEAASVEAASVEAASVEAAAVETEAESRILLWDSVVVMTAKATSAS